MISGPKQPILGLRCSYFEFFGCKFTALHYGCEKGHHKTINALLSHLEPDNRLKLVLIREEYGGTALDLAAEEGKTEVIRSLKASIKDDEWFHTLKHCDMLYCASQYDQLDVIKTVLESMDYDQRHEILMKYTYNRTPLHIITEGQYSNSEGHTRCWIERHSMGASLNID